MTIFPLGRFSARYNKITAVRVAGISMAIGTRGGLFNALRGNQGRSKEISGESDSL
jgi:hypothetical protein